MARSKSKKDALVSAYRRPRPPDEPQTINLNINLLLSGAVGVTLGGELALKFPLPSPKPPPDQPPQAWFTLKSGGRDIVKGRAPMAYTLPVDKMVVVAVQYADAAGNVVDLPQGNVQWETSDPTILGAQADANDDQQCSLTPAGTVGNAQVTCTGSNPDSSQVIATLDVTVVSGDAVTGTIQPTGEPQPIGPHVEPRAKKR